MIDPARFQLIKEKYGHCGSWAVSADSDGRPKANIGEMSIFDDGKRDGLLSQLKPDVVLVGLNFSRGSVQVPLGNFHDKRPEAQDYKLRHALKGTSLWGAYITDIIKDYDQKASGKVMAYLRDHKDIEAQNVEHFKDELRDLGAEQPTIIALGGSVFTVLNRNLGDQYKVWKMRHYSSYVALDQYREEWQALINTINSQPSV